MKPLVSIITVNYNQLDQTIEFVQNIKRHDYKEVEIIVVDNNSNESPDRLMIDFPEIILIKSRKNLGFAGGNNLGIKAARGKYLFLVNNDVYLQDETIENLVKRLESDPAIGAVSPKIKFFDQPDIIQYAGFNRINRITGRNSAVGSLMRDTGQFDVAGKTHYTHGAAMMLKRHVVEQVGLMPEMYFLYYEEIDWCNQIKNKGYSIYYEPMGVALHKQSLSSGKNSPLKIFYLTRNRIVFMRRNVSIFHFSLFLFHLFLFALPKNMIVMALKREMKQMYAFLKALAAVNPFYSDLNKII